MLASPFHHAQQQTPQPYHQREFLPKIPSPLSPRSGNIHGNGSARFEIAPEGPDTSRLTFQGNGEIGGLVAGVGQRILSSVSKHLVGRFFVALRKEVETPAEGAA